MGGSACTPILALLLIQERQFKNLKVMIGGAGLYRPSANYSCRRLSCMAGAQRMSQQLCQTLFYGSGKRNDSYRQRSVFRALPKCRCSDRSVSMLTAATLLTWKTLSDNSTAGHNFSASALQATREDKSSLHDWELNRGEKRPA